MKRRSAVAKPNGHSGTGGFEPLFRFGVTQDGIRTFLSQKGLHRRIEAFMVANPNSRVPAKAFAKKFGASGKYVGRIAKQVQEAHGFPARKPGGPNHLLPDQIALEIKRIYLRLPKNTEIRIYDVVRDIAVSTGGLVPSLKTVARRIKRLELVHGKKLKIVGGATGAEWKNTGMLIYRLQREPVIIQKQIKLRRLKKDVKLDSVKVS